MASLGDRLLEGGWRRTNTTAEWTGPSCGWRAVAWFLGLDISLIRLSWAVGLSALIINTDTKPQISLVSMVTSVHVLFYTVGNHDLEASFLVAYVGELPLPLFSAQ